MGTVILPVDVAAWLDEQGWGGDIVTSIEKSVSKNWRSIAQGVAPRVGHGLTSLATWVLVIVLAVNILFFLIKDGVLKTPPTWQALAGITRETTIDIAESRGVPVDVTPLQPYDVYTADEAFFTSTPYCIMPATRFNGLPVGDGTVGAITKGLLDGWSELAGFDIVDKAIRNLEPPLRDELLAER